MRENLDSLQLCYTHKSPQGGIVTAVLSCHIELLTNYSSQVQKLVVSK